MGRRWYLVGAAVAAMTAAAWGAWRLGPARGAAVRREPGLSVLLITIDTLRADALGFAGNRLPVAWNNLGVALYQLREPGAAFKAWQRAVDLQPDLWDTLWTLATKAAESGWNQLARISFERFLAKAPPDRYGEQLRKARLYLAELKRGRAAGLKSRAAS